MLFGDSDARSFELLALASPWFGLRRPETLLIKQYFITPENIFKHVFHGVCHQHFLGVDEDFHKLMDSFKWDQPLAPLHILNMK